MITLATSVRPSKEDERGVVYTAVLGRHLVGLGDEVALVVGRQQYPHKYVVYKSTKALREVTEEDLERLLPAFHDIRLFWKRLESDFGGGIPGEFEVTFLGLTKDYEKIVEDVLLGEDDYEPEAYEEFLEDIIIVSDLSEYEEYEELYDDEPQIDPIKPKKPKGW